MKKVPVNDKKVKQVGYNEKKKILTVDWKSGKTSEYKNVKLSQVEDLLISNDMETFIKRKIS